MCPAREHRPALAHNGVTTRVRQQRLAVEALQPRNAARRNGERRLAAGLERDAIEQDCGAGHARGREQVLAASAGAGAGWLGRNRLLIEDDGHACSPPPLPNSGADG